MKVACVGTRNLSYIQAKNIAAIGAYLAHKKNTVISGNAEGSDHAFAMGANSVNPARVELYLPWPTFRFSNIIRSNGAGCPGNEVWTSPTGDDFEGAYDVWQIYREGKYGYPSWWTLAPSTRSLMARNFALIKASDEVIAVPELDGTGKPKGGTAFAINCADFMNLPYKVISLDHLNDPSYDRCRDCGLPRSIGARYFACPNPYHQFKPYE